jgi:type IV pilus assembly protein PilE
MLPFSATRSAGMHSEFVAREREFRSGITTASRCGGFTLVELMIAIAVVAILTRIAYPSYLEYVKRGHRSSAQSLMLDLANREQQYLLDNRSFLGGGASAVTTLLPSGVPPEVSAFYTMTITATAGPPPTFEVKATPITGTVMAGESPFTLDQDGTRLPAGKWQGR